jgi:indolepyruvate ferredoxin oxidoreductase, alpha subunit
MGIKVIGKDVLPVIGEYSAALLREKILLEVNDTNIVLNEAAPVRPPVMCPGCPHRGMFYVLKKLKLNVNGDIGCYTLGALPPSQAMDTCICMGASIGMAHGMEKARGKEFGKKTVAVIGDSTFMHSGITGLIDIVYNKGNSTVFILDNSITGMTGHQHNPTTGFTIKGEPTRQVDLEKLSYAVGVERVRVVDPFDIEEFEKVVREEIQAEEPSVIISQRPCALLKHVKFEGPQKISSEACKKCKKCLSIGCPAIVDRGETLEINEALCVGCKLCTKVCSFDAIEKAGDNNGKA